MQVAAGYKHTIFVAADGLVFATGDNSDGQLGVGDTEDRLAPTPITGQLESRTAVYVAAGDRHTLCITSDGSLFSWGRNVNGQLGVGDTEDRHLPTLVTGLQGKQVTHVAAGRYHTMCSTADGSVFSWGEGDEGKLGLGDEGDDMLVPTLVRGKLQNKQVLQVTAGRSFSMCATEDGSVYTWGDNAYGQLGGADIVNASIASLPVLVHNGI